MSTPRKDPEKRRGSRYRARRRAVDILFEAEFRDVDPVAIVEDRIELSQRRDLDVAPVNPYTQQIVGGVAVELDRVDETIARYLAKNWVLERIPAVDRAILRIAVWELLFNPEVPIKTAVVEGVELGSQYSTDFAAPYINAVLDAVAKNIEELRAEALAEINSDEDEAAVPEAEQQEASDDVQPMETPVEVEEPVEATPESSP
ncbi:MAG: transcription antitermination factor NusB [Corynebacterium sp.]|nr:transcription antitermination factor NusB [Corynebacterium sp.]